MSKPAQIRALRSDMGAWYDIDHMRRSSVVVELMLECGAAVPGKVDSDPARGKAGREHLFWWEARRSGFVRLSPYRVRHARSNPHPREPVAWRPLDPTVWPDPLPVPLPRALLPGSSGIDAAPAPETPVPEVDGWPYPEIRLGERMPPTSEKECEARIWRALRKMDTLPKVGLSANTLAADIPRELYFLMRRKQLLDAIREGLRDSHIGDVRVAWTPTRRDNGDWDYALDWWGQLARKQRKLFRYRAANPQWSWRQIEAEEGRSYEQLRVAYHVALKEAFRIAIGRRNSDIGARELELA